jgi:hypothetical protein
LAKDIQVPSPRRAEFQRRWAALRLAAPHDGPAPVDNRADAASGTTTALQDVAADVLTAGNTCLGAPRPDSAGLQELHDKLASLEAGLRDRRRYSLSSTNRSRVAESVGRCLDAVAYLLAVIDLNAPQDGERPAIGAPQEADRTAASLMRAREMDYARARFRERFNQLAAQLDRVASTGGPSSEEG